MKGLICVFFAALLALWGCSPPEEPAGQEPGAQDAVTLVYYTIGEPDEDLALVNDALNEILYPKYGFYVDYRKIGWNDYENMLATIVNTNQPFDIAFAWTDNYLSNAKEGNWLDLTPYLDTIGAEMRREIDETFWTGVCVDGRVFGVPTKKELSTPLHLLFAKELTEKYSIDISQFDSLASLEPALALIAQHEPGCIPFYMDATHYNLMDTLGYEYISYENIPLMIRSADETCRVVNVFETPEFMELLQRMHAYYNAGYINQDACLRTDLSRFDDEAVFLRLSYGGPDADTSYSSSFGYPIEVQQIGESVATTTSTRGGIMVVNARSKHPEQCIQFLNCVNTDPQVRNLLNYGIEGVHYELNAHGQVRTLSNRYAGITYTQGNWFILHVREGENPNRWQLYGDFNDNTRESQILGFTPDYSQHPQELSEVTRIYDKYYSPLITGSVDPDVYVPKMIREMKQAGIDTLRETVQQQIDVWLANEKNVSAAESRSIE